MRDCTDITEAIERHADTVIRICSLFFQARPERDDAFQETFLKYAQSEKAFADGEHVKAWLITVASNVCKDMLKQSEARTVLLGSIDENSCPSWSNECSEEGQGEKLATALRQLEDTYRITLYLKYYEGYTASEIARIMDMPENTVYTNLARGKEKLKEVLTHGEQW